MTRWAITDHPWTGEYLETMCRLIIIAVLFSSSASCSRADEMRALPADKGITSAPETRDETPVELIWQIEPSYNGIVAVVGVDGKGPNGVIRTTLRVQCPTPANDVTTIEFVVRKTGRVKDFNFDSFEGPYAPNLRKKLVEFNRHTEKGTDKWLAMVHGSYGADDRADAFRFGLSSFNDPDKTNSIAQTLASGTASLTVIAHDGRDWNRTLEATFPKLDPNTETASVLNGCKK